MARTEPATIAVPEQGENPPPPPPFRPGPRCPGLLWAFNVVWIVAVTLVVVVATMFIEPYFIGGLQIPVMRRRPGAQPAVVGVPAAPPHRVIRRPRVWFLFAMALIAMSIKRGPTLSDPPAETLLSAACAPINGLVEIPLGHSAAPNTKALSCAMVFGLNVVVASCKANYQ